eukprot:gene21103-27991_t
MLQTSDKLFTITALTLPGFSSASDNPSSAPAFSGSPYRPPPPKPPLIVPCHSRLHPVPIAVTDGMPHKQNQL